MIKKQKHAADLIPKNEETTRVLQARAKQLAKQETDKTQNNGVPFVRFGFNKDEYYGVPYQHVQEILPRINLVKPPFTPPFIVGVINWRGSLITVIDLFQFFHQRASNNHRQKNNEFIIIINSDEVTLGLLTPQIQGSDIYLPDQLSTPLSSVNTAKPEYILGLHHAVTAMIHVEALISNLCVDIKKSLYKIGAAHESY